MSRRNRFYCRYIKRHKKDYNTKKYIIEMVQYGKSTT